MPAPTVQLSPAEIVRIIGDTSERAIAYVQSPDPRLTRLPRKFRENVISDLPPVTAGALLGTAALARHFVASAASGRYRDLFSLWELFRTDPDACRPVLAERQEALAKARGSLRTAVRLGLRGRADLLAVDIARAEGLIWRWLREALVEELPVVGARPALASAMLLREPDLDVRLPEAPDDRWLSEAAAAAEAGQLAEPVERLFGANLDKLPGTVATLSLARDRFPQKVPTLVERIDLHSPEIGALLAWTRDHGHGDVLRRRIAEQVEEQAADDAQQGLTAWWTWRERGVDVPLPTAVESRSLDDFDLTRPETAELAARLVDDGREVAVQSRLDALAGQNRQLAEKAYEAFVCAGHDVHLPATLRDNQTVKEGTRCPWCEAWTWVRPGHERRCPRAHEGEPAAAAQAPALDDDWTLPDAASDTGGAEATAEAPAGSAAPDETATAVSEQAGEQQPPHEEAAQDETPQAGNPQHETPEVEASHGESSTELAESEEAAAPR